MTHCGKFGVVPLKKLPALRLTLLVASISIDLVWKSRHGLRMTAHERRLHRLWGRCQEVQKQLNSGLVDRRLLDNFLRNAANLVQDGLIEAHALDVDSVPAALLEALHSLSKQVAASPFQNWKAQATHGGLKGLFDFVGGKIRPGLAAVFDGGLSADPGRVQAAAQQKWEQLEFRVEERLFATCLTLHFFFDYL